MELDEREDMGFIQVKWSSKLYGTVEMKARYWLHQKGSENFYGELDFIKEHFQELYDKLLENLFEEYSENPLLDVWDEETGEFERIMFATKEEMHPYLGMTPCIDVKSFKDKVYLGLTFYQHNRLSIEHGICAIFDKLELFLVDSYDFEGILDNLKYGYKSGF